MMVMVMIKVMAMIKMVILRNSDDDDQGGGQDRDDDVDDGFIQTCQLRVSSSMCSLLKTSRESVQYWQIESDDEFAKS